jgi:hypothetical protein
LHAGHVQNRDVIGAFTEAETFGNGNNGAVNYSNKRAKVWSLGEGGNRLESGGFSHGNLTGLFHKSDPHIHCISEIPIIVRAIIKVKPPNSNQPT